MERWRRLDGCRGRHSHVTREYSRWRNPGIPRGVFREAHVANRWKPFQGRIGDSGIAFPLLTRPSPRMEGARGWEGRARPPWPLETRNGATFSPRRYPCANGSTDVGAAGEVVGSVGSLVGTAGEVAGEAGGHAGAAGEVAGEAGGHVGAVRMVIHARHIFTLSGLKPDSSRSIAKSQGVSIL